MPARKNPVRNHHPMYVAWCMLRQRCDNPANADVARLYKGITYENRWSDFINFYEDMAAGWERGLSIDRIDNSKGYSKANCRWATPKQQANNTRRNRRLTKNGVTKTLAQWSEHLGVKSSTIRMRIDSYGWPISRALERK